MRRSVALIPVLLLISSVLWINHGFPTITGLSAITSYSSTTDNHLTTSSLSSSASSTTSTSRETTRTITGTTSAVSSSVSTSASHSIAGSRIGHVIIIVMENEGYDQVVGSSSAPYENLLISRYVLAANYNAVSHPSLPNYIALVAGDTFGITNDCQPNQCSLPNASITNLLDSHGLSWREYAESMPVNCSQSTSQDGLYVPRHNPFVYFSSITNNTGSGVTSQYCNTHVVPFTQFWNDLQSSNLPSFALITPNICNDGHDCNLTTADDWLSTVIPRIISSSSFSSTALFVVYDEGSGSGTNSPSHVVCILVSPFAKPGYSSNTQYSHHSLLATVETIFSVGNLGRNDSTAATMSDLFTINLSSR